ncbi:MAG TPA: hypothetical protein VLA93_15440 [Pyrinomonadaceae bacterium]|nr:hypothetical protein [Pyrinomonadaceae bacterium]
MAGMFGSTVLDVAIGLVFVYLLLAIICTSANEILSGVTKSRGNLLKEGIRQLLGNQPTSGAKNDPLALFEEFYKHGLITSMMRDNRHPAYLPARTFSTVVVDLLTKDRPGRLDVGDIEAGLKALPEGGVKESLLAVVHNTGRNLGEVQLAIEGWFEDAMDRVTGWYKRKTQIWTVVLAISITLLSNADTVQIARRLWRDPVLRTAVVEEAKIRAQKPRPSVTVEYPNPDDPTNPQITSNEGNTVSPEEQALLGQVLGWQNAMQDTSKRAWLERILGWILTILAICLGAPFWFDLLNKFVNIRSAGKAPDEKPKRPEKPKMAPADKTA